MTDEVDDADKFLLQPVKADEDVRVVYGKTTHPRQATQLATLFVTVNGAELRQSVRQIAIALW